MSLNRYFLEEYLRRPSITSLEELKSFLPDLLSSVETDFRRTIRAAETERGQRPVVLFGAGLMGRRIAKDLAGCGRPADLFCDNNPRTWGELDGLAVKSPEYLKTLASPLVIIASGSPATAAAVEAELSAGFSGLDIHNPHRSGLGEVLKNERLLSGEVEYLHAHMAQVEAVFYRLRDERSRFVYLNAIRARFFPEPLSHWMYSDFMEGGQYWALPEFTNNTDAVFVDCGAYIGDSVAGFLQHCHIPSLKKIYAFEPVKSSYRILKKNVDLFTRFFHLDPARIECHNLGLAETAASHMSLTTSPLSQHHKWDVPIADQAGPAQEGETHGLELVSLDAFLAGVPVTFLKADIEGYELDMLKGASSLIRTYRPKLAISIYHLRNDYFEIPSYIMKMAPEYHMAVRHHSSCAEETILYCWI